MSVHDDLGNRMKTYYEEIPKTKLIRRVPVCIGCDGKAFHSWTKGFKKPFDSVLIKTMQDTMKYLCENIQGVVLGYTQSDEITLVLVDYAKLTSQAWFDYEVQKMCSVAASMATMEFNKIFNNIAWSLSFISEFDTTDDIDDINYAKEFGFDITTEEGRSELQKYYPVYINAAEKGAMFDCRVFNIPKEEVANCIYWRELDATRNSIQMVGQSQFSHKELCGKSCNMIQDMLHEQRGINWNDLSTYQKRGSCCIKINEEVNGVMRSKWVVDDNIPIFKGEGRNYIEKLINVGE